MFVIQVSKYAMCKIHKKDVRNPYIMFIPRLMSVLDIFYQLG